MTKKGGIKERVYFLQQGIFGIFLGIYLKKGHLRFIFSKVEIDPGYFRCISAKGLNFNQGIIGIFL